MSSIFAQSRARALTRSTVPCATSGGTHVPKQQPRATPGQMLARWVPGLLILCGFIGSMALGQAAFPRSLRVPLGQVADRSFEWGIENLVWLYGPIANFLEASFEWLQFTLMDLPAPTVAMVLMCVVVLRAGWSAGIFMAGTIGFVISVELWSEALETVALMTVAVGLSAAAGVALGILSNLHEFFRSSVLTALDAMQTFPIFAYLVPVVFIFGPGNVAAIVVTIIWALPPITRLTIVGLAGVSKEAVEAATSAGATRAQLLFGVKLRLARPSIMAGLNQTVLFAMSMATVASMIGADGLGQPLWDSLNRLEFGLALEAGIALVLFAIILDRVSAGNGRSSRGSKHALAPLQALAVGGALLVAAVAVQLIQVLRLADFTKPPAAFQISLREPVVAAVDWINLNLGFLIDPVVNAAQRFVLNPVVDAVLSVPWPFVVGVTAAAATATMGAVRSCMIVAALLGIGAIGMWEPAGVTLGIAAISVLAGILIAAPIGIAMSRSDRVERVLTPTLDVLQTIPIFLFVIPAVVVLSSGPVSGVLATIAYIVPPIIRITNVALRGIDPEAVEAATSFGATTGQVLRQVRVPLGMPTLAVAVNQAIMLALAMAVVSAFIGTPGLGQELLAAVYTGRLSNGIEAGVAMFLLAVVVDRLVSSSSQMVLARHHLSAIQNG